MEAAAALAAEVRGVGRRSPREAYPADLRARVVEYCVEGRRQGTSWRGLSRLLGLRQTTLVRWYSAAEAESTGTGALPGFLPVVVDAGGRLPERRSEGALRVTSPSGWKVEGVVLEDVIRLLGALG